MLTGYDLLAVLQQFWRVLAEGDAGTAKEILAVPDATYLLGIPAFEHVDDPALGLEELRDLYAQANDPITWGNIALLAGHYDDPGLAIDAWARTLPAVPDFLQFLWHPIMCDVRREPGFKNLVRDVGLVSYWRESGWPEYCRPLGNEDFECR